MRHEAHDEVMVQLAVRTRDNRMIIHTWYRVLLWDGSPAAGRSILDLGVATHRGGFCDVTALSGGSNVPRTISECPPGEAGWPCRIIVTMRRYNLGDTI